MKTTRTLLKLIAAMEELRKLHDEMPLQMAVTFLYLASAGPSLRKDVERFIGKDESAVHRNLRALSGPHYLNGKYREGMGLLEKRAAPPGEDPRATLWAMTAKGRRVVASLEQLLEDT